MRHRILGLLFFAPFFLSVQAAAAELVYFGSAACSVCERWEEEVGDIYPKTEEARILPLRFQDIHDPRPQDIKFVRGVVYTPTFVAIDQGQEVGRIVGYMGDFFFWEQVGYLVKKLALKKDPNVSACHDGQQANVHAPC